MPQMSPLGWVWVVFLVLLGYFMFLVFCYSIVMDKVILGDFKIVLEEIFWVW